ncbi:cytochrome P450 [Aspergillus homomorphus CBS 101889]|uniref:Cytochrome P450 n=1 Tax=Aspergillus homomorphus (strain CBS 101889) TaxID=1450537 RepID=A0A395HUY1_ASPHC|nr:cytochrome P450 [Aspergillus homomorphus CBS 101889]RAL10034.1 cytochrome P450 [Aspergillus homomorphus CBS 101889]
MSQFPPNTAISTYYTEIAHKYDLKGIFYLDLWPFGPSQMILVDPDAAELVTTIDNYPLHDEVARYLTPLLGEDAIGAADGEKWKMLHQILVPAFRPSNIKAAAPIIAEQVSKLLSPALTAHAQTGEVFSMEKYAAQLVFGISSMVILGDNVSKEEATHLLKSLNHIVDYATTLTLTTAVNPLTKANKWWKKRAATQQMDLFLQRFVTNRFAQIAEGKIGRDGTNLTMLDTILSNARGTQCEAHDPTALKPAFLRIVIDNLKGLLLGGFGTTADTLCYVFIMLAFHPTVVTNLREEHNNVFGSDIGSPKTILQKSPHKLDELVYTTAVIKETLRLFPVGFGARRAKPGTTLLTYNNMHYPTRDQMIIPCTHTIHYDPEVFPHPTTFDPARFLDSTAAKVPKDAWRPFERGARACPGRGLAMDELRIILLLTIRHFDFQCAGVDSERSITARARHTDMDLAMGDLAFQEMGFSAKARGGTMMRVSAVRL